MGNASVPEIEKPFDTQPPKCRRFVQDEPSEMLAALLIRTRELETQKFIPAPGPYSIAGGAEADYRIGKAPNVVHDRKPSV